METELPLSRIRTIMKSSLNTGQITNEVLFLMTKATEMFVQKLTEEAYAKVKEDNNLKYKHLSQYVQKEKNLEFLLQIVPAKIKVKDFKKILELDDVNSSSDSEDERRSK
ncbi:PREDICTED: chromatin accessibility complex protein 1 [Rhagoletis zephyria]|uniref:chromatin accessibility complex protein 1 n=1 Tax=Rhagoletis zephyria TaxID=28612 RepID=UPI000811A7D9|nr:PREDICTED: chromatin accessibility complex protein 1 [Rhagoletis zephyria]XP_036330343.1 chromatin accessibility complex 16kD protein [Rhagoletis pomonella]